MARDTERSRERSYFDPKNILIFENLEGLALEGEDVVLFGEKHFFRNNDTGILYDLLFHGISGINDTSRVESPCSLVVPVLDEFSPETLNLSDGSSRFPGSHRFTRAIDGKLHFYDVLKDPSLGSAVISLDGYDIVDEGAFFRRINSPRMRHDIDEARKAIDGLYAAAGNN
jgi:hypothetical protein